MGTFNYIFGELLEIWIDVIYMHTSCISGGVVSTVIALEETRDLMPALFTICKVM